MSTRYFSCENFFLNIESLNLLIGYHFSALGFESLRADATAFLIAKGTEQVIQSGGSATAVKTCVKKYGLF